MLRTFVDELRQWAVVAESSVVGDYCLGRTGGSACWRDPTVGSSQRGPLPGVRPPLANGPWPDGLRSNWELLPKLGARNSCLGMASQFQVGSAPWAAVA